MINSLAIGRRRKLQPVIQRRMFCFGIVASAVLACTAYLNLLVQKRSNGIPDSIYMKTLHPSGDGDPFRQLLRYANTSLPENDVLSLPKWQEVEDMFGIKPRILGLENCKAYRRQVPEILDRMIAPAGVFNSGTNLLFIMLEKNCKVKPLHNQSRGRFKIGVGRQVNWGKIWIKALRWYGRSPSVTSNP